MLTATTSLGLAPIVTARYSFSTANMEEVQVLIDLLNAQVVHMDIV
jgi:hypothetical protein